MTIRPTFVWHIFISVNMMTEETLTKIRQTLCGFLTHLGIEPKTKYHETLTNAWILVVKHSMSITPTKNSASEFLSANPQLLNSKLLDTYYSKDILDTDLARDSFIEPNLLPLPGLWR